MRHGNMIKLVAEKPKKKKTAPSITTVFSKHLLYHHRHNLKFPNRSVSKNRNTLGPKYTLDGQILLDIEKHVIPVHSGHSLFQ